MGLLDGGRTDRLRHRCSHHSGCNIDVSPFVAGANSHPKTDRQTDGHTLVIGLNNAKQMFGDGYESDKPRDRLIVENGTKISHAYLVSTLNWLGLGLKRRSCSSGSILWVILIVFNWFHMILFEFVIFALEVLPWKWLSFFWRMALGEGLMSKIGSFSC